MYLLTPTVREGNAVRSLPAVWRSFEQKLLRFLRWSGGLFVDSRDTKTAGEFGFDFAQANILVSEQDEQVIQQVARLIDQVVAACIARMGPVAFWDAYEMGKNMTLEEATADSLAEA